MSTTPTYEGGVAAVDGGAVALIARRWWVWLVTGIAWCLAALAILQFDKASVTTVGVITGLMFIVSGFQQIVMGAAAERLRWLWYVFAGLFIVAGILALIRPVNTFVGLADMLGFLLLLVGVWWTMEPFVLRRADAPLWWFGFITGPLMILAAFWTSGQFFFHKAYILLVIAGVWALCHGVMDILRAFAIRSLRED